MYILLEMSIRLTPITSETRMIRAYPNWYLVFISVTKSVKRNRKYEKKRRIISFMISSWFKNFAFIGNESQRYFMNIKFTRILTNIFTVRY